MESGKTSLSTGSAFPPEVIAGKLAQHFDFQANEVAWVSHQGRTYYSVVAKNFGGPATAVTKLIQYLFDEHVDLSFFILRNRIFTTAALRPLDQGMVKLAAKRATGAVSAVRSAADRAVPPLDLVELGERQDPILHSRFAVEAAPVPGSARNESEAAEILRSLISAVPRGKVLHDYNRPIAVLICGPDGDILESATNNNSKNKTLHAEVVALQRYWTRTKQKLPLGSRMYVSLKPCQMCAAMIEMMIPDVQLVYFEDDPGPMAMNTRLEKLGRQKKSAMKL